MRIFVLIIMLACGIAFSQPVRYADGTLCECDETYKIYYESGALEHETAYKDDEMYGIEKWYYESGELM